jgi:type IX secretion system PorP/SprF family membrane protein
MTKIKYINRKLFQSCFILLLAILPSIKSKAQLNPMSSIYYRNQYLANPAMAGMQQRLYVNAGLRQQFTVVPGAPVTQSVTVDYGFAGKAAAGLALSHDVAGVLNRNRIAGSLAYHLPLDDDGRHVSFGLSATLAMDNIDLSKVQGNINDPDLLNINLRENYIDADFGAAYTSNKLQIQATLPNMKQVLRKDIYHTVDLPVFFSAISYRAQTDIGTIEPKVVYRGVKGFKNLLDVGANFEFQSITPNTASFFVMYHSAKSATFGIGVNCSSSLSLNGMYTTNTSPLQGYTNGDFELNISYSIFKK